MTDWFNKKSMDQKRAADRLRGNNYGKGDKRRPENNNKFRLGLRLIELAEAGKKDTEEYKAALNAWRNA